jgi:hypothetical protein
MIGFVNDSIDLHRLSLAELKALNFNPIIQPEWVPVGSVEFVRILMARLGRESIGLVPKRRTLNTYPSCLRPWMIQDILETTYEAGQDGRFVKPIHDIKAFTGHIKGGVWPAGEPRPAGLDGMPVYSVAPVRFEVEARCYVVHGTIRGVVPYVEFEDDVICRLDMDVIKSAVRAFNDEHQIDGYVIDFGVCPDNSTMVIEWNDGWALGYYRDDHFGILDYMDLIEARWMQVVENAIKGQLPGPEGGA